jgi:hypothetical protein
MTVFKGSDQLTKIKNYYVSKIQQSRSLVSQFAKYKVFAFPLIEDTLSSLRALVKNSDLLTQVQQGNQEESGQK